MQTPIELYNKIYRQDLQKNIESGMSEDKASRKANLTAVKNTWKCYIFQFKLKELDMDKEPVPTKTFDDEGKTSIPIGKPRTFTEE